MAACATCGAENPAGMRFCGDCGGALASSCPSCGGENPPGKRFCGHCGSSLEAAALVPAVTAAPTVGVERRHVTVLFADLVGFTAASESRDAEDTRLLLSQYFETCQRLISRYGGTVEKFIGDAVMAVWGTPVANEDDAERAVRAALDLVAAVAELAPGLEARAGVLTGEAAVTLGAEGQGMVAGDLVNTASRIQSAAEAGTVLVGDTTRRATEAAIAYEPAGEHALKGKTEPVSLHRAIRVIAARGGALRSEALEPPFVGRDRELRLVKELFHACGEEGKAQLVSAVGIAGIGKSRLAWEFEKYIDGLADFFTWHRGRCLAYGDGVAYWALAEMVRMRADIAEDEPAEPALAKLRGAVEQYVPDADERSWLEPRLAHLLGLAERTAPDREDLFSAWRLFFERIADRQPVILVFEDLQWADTGLLDFIDYLLEWSRNHPIFVLALSRPELAERRPAFGAAGRNLTTISLEPLVPAAMERLLDGFVPGLPGELRSQILSRAEGVPLYAVETIRMLLDRGLLAREGDVYRPTGEIESLDVPETLHALVSARLDGLGAEERRLLQDAAVLGKSFTKAGLAALSGLPESEIERHLTGLVRKEVFSAQADPRSPERGHYSFLQDLLKRVAYETLAKQERKARHLAAAAHLADAYGAGEQEIVEVIAAHYVDAYRAAPDADDATNIKALAQQMLTRAGERAASLAANDEAVHYFERAAELSDDVTVEAGLLERAGTTAWASGHVERARTHLARAMELFEADGLTHPAARVSARLGVVEWKTTQLGQALERMEHAFEVLSGDEPDEDLATLAAELGRLYYFRGDLELAEPRIETAVQVAEFLWLPEVLSQALNTQGLIAGWRGRPEQSLALLKHALTLALDHDLAAAALRAYNNLGDQLDRRDRHEEAIENHERGIALARKAGDRMQGWRLAGELSWCLQRLGRWDESLAHAREIPVDQRLRALSGMNAEIEIAAARGDLEWAQQVLEEMSPLQESADLQEREAVLASAALIHRMAGRYDEAYAVAQEILARAADRLEFSVDLKSAQVEALEAALALGRLDLVEEHVAWIDAIPPGVRPPSLRAQAARFQARLRAARGEHAKAEQGFKTAEAIFREHGLVFPLAVAQLEHGEWLVARGRSEDAEALVREARETFERLEAAPYLGRVDAVGAGAGAGAGVAAVD